MPRIHKSTIRRARQAERRQERNRATINTVRTLIKKVQSAVTGKKLDEAKTSLLEATSAIGKAVSKGILHRNIRRDNVFMQGGKPVLRDFGWAISEHDAYFSPLGLGGYERSPDALFSDVYSMGKILEYVNRQHYRPFDWVISLMTMEDASLRITDLVVLRTLFDTALKIILKDCE